MKTQRLTAPPPDAIVFDHADDADPDLRDPASEPYSGDLAGFTVVITSKPIVVDGNDVDLWLDLPNGRVVFRTDLSLVEAAFRWGFDAGVCAARAQLGMAGDQTPPVDPNVRD